MGRKNKKLDYVEQLERENKELKEVNKSLLRRLRKLEKQSYRDELEEETEKYDDFVMVDPEETSEKCRECGKGKIYEVDLGSRKLRKCDRCPWRSKAEKVKS